MFWRRVVGIILYDKTMFMVTEMGAMSESLMMFIKRLALVVDDQISCTVRCQAESQVAFMMRRRIAQEYGKSLRKSLRTVFAFDWLA